MENDLIAFAQQMDRCWIEGRFDDLSAYLADDVVMAAPGGLHRTKGFAAAVASYRDFMHRATVSRFHTQDYVVTHSHATAVVEYGWDMAWTDHGRSQEAKGQEILALAKSEQGWRVVWRMQVAA